MPAGELIRRYVEVARPIILDDFAPNCCIAATAITLGVFRSLGIRAEPFSCRVVIFNRAFIDRSERAGRVPQTPAEVHEWTGDGLSWSLGVGWPAPHLTGWPGHLVALVEDALIDASIEQANRPAKGIVLPPVLAAKAPEPFRLGREKFFLHSPDGLLIYEPSKDRSWRNAPDWVHRDRHGRAILRILAEIGIGST